ncbi:ClpXP protease specificity-enhancing factor [Enterovibrio sp. ZSDZ35]|uniref:ClpXP protease specificity-enhancing factor n=1 Tax=Enterovibrio qingdaonensis TaxID=2899818 RepID=A0ABT5QMP7_9GAMM|nr:ClpXP protease specificity-enhancing factor [Enterovibrio sp. ZSDZ35]MDD1782248.1 ClpXP protease specificity-enhancing factor [Enterovibrio sp. ZSDZ35]
MDDINLTPRRPYLLRAFHDWLLDNDLTPHLVVDAMLPNVVVPFEYVQDGQIVLNIAPRAVGNLELGNDEVRFNARFGGRPMTVTVPLYAVVAIYARENGAGTMFESEPAYEAELEGIEIIEDQSDEPVLDTVEETAEVDDVPDEAPIRPKGRPTLTVVK